MSNDGKLKLTETDLAKKFISHLEHQGEIYKEVEASGFIDIFMIKHDGYSVAVEVKTSFNFKVIEQAEKNLKYANFSYVAVPYVDDYQFRVKICKLLGVGVLMIKENGKIFQYAEPKYSNRPKKIRLNEANKYAEAGCQHGRPTNFSVTKNEIINYLTKSGGYCLYDNLFKNISHHYKNDKAAISSTKAWCKKGVIKEFEFDGKYIKLK